MSRDKFSDAVAPARQAGKMGAEEHNYGRVEPFVPRKRENEYKDTGTDSPEERIVNNPELKKLYAKTPGTVARGKSRPAAAKTMVEAECSICHTKAEVEAIYAHASYRCNECFKPNRGGRRRRG